jgi:hypothetical protein
MKKYLTLAAVLGTIAFLSVSYIAQAQQPAAPAATAPAAAPAAGSAMQAAVPAASTYAKDHAECEALASAPSTEGAAASDAEKTATLKKCLVAKGHTLAEIATEEAKSAAPAAPAAPAAH